MEPTQNRSAGTVNPLTGRTRTGGTFDTATGGAIPQAPTTAIPVSAIETTAPAPLTMPTPPPSTVNSQAAIASADQAIKSFQEQNLAFEQASVQKAAQKESETEQAIRNAVGLLGTESQVRNEMESQKGIPRMNEQLNNLTNQIIQATNNLREFDRFNVNEQNAMEVDASRRDITKRTFASMSREAQVKANVERANMAADIYALQSSSLVLQGNLQQATDMIDKALNAAYDPIRQELEMEKVFLQRNANRFDSAMTREANARLAVVEQQQAEIDRAIATVDAAVATGYASADDIKKMTSLSGNPEAQRAYAQSIIAKSAFDTMALDRAYKNAQIANVHDSIASRQEANQLRLAELFGKQQKDVLEQQEQKSLATEKALGIQSLAEKILNHSAFSSAIGPISSRIGGVASVSGLGGARAEFNALVDQLAGMLTLDNTKFLKGAMSDKDIELITNAASRLKAKGMSEDAYKSAVREVIDAAARTVTQNGLTTEQAIFFGYISPEEANVINNNFSSSLSTSSFDPSIYFKR